MFSVLAWYLSAVIKSGLPFVITCTLTPTNWPSNTTLIKIHAQLHVLATFSLPQAVHNCRKKKRMCIYTRNDFQDFNYELGLNYFFIKLVMSDYLKFFYMYNCVYREE